MKPDSMTAVQPIETNGAIRGFTTNVKETVNKGFYYAPCSETGLDGPDQVKPANNFTTTKPDEAVRIQLSYEGVASLPPMSIPGLFSNIVKEHPDRVALIGRPDENGHKKTYTYREYEKEVKSVAKAFLKLGLERYHGVSILGFNSPEWFITDIAAIYAGGFAVGVYTTNSAEACQYCAENSRSNIIVVEDAKQLEKILQIKHNLPHLKKIIQYEGTPQEEGVLSWDELIKLGESQSEDKLNEVLKTIGANECCTLIYTSGTVGNPKAVMLSHDNLVQDAKMIINNLEKSEYFDKDNITLISYLPLSHVAAQIVDMFIGMIMSATVHFADKNALKGSLVDTLVVARPTIFVGVPRVWEKIYEKMQAVARNNGIIKSWISSWAKSHGLHYNLNKIDGNESKSWGYSFASWLIFSKVKATLGLDKSILCISAAAPLSNEIKQYFMSLDILINDAYGMSECSGAHTLSTPSRFKLGTVGPVLSEVNTKLDNQDSTGEGEVCMSGRHVFMGYLNEPEKTAEALDENGWLHSGDLGKLDSDGFLSITGRIKELIITAGGENIPPVHIEQLVLAELPALSNALLVGDKRKYLTILVTLKTEMDINTGEPKDEFTKDTLKWLQTIGSKSKTVSDVLQTQDSVVYKEIENAIKRANTNVISNAQRVQKFRILPHDFSVPTGELGPTLKLKRNIVYKMYENLIEDMYE